MKKTDLEDTEREEADRKAIAERLEYYFEMNNIKKKPFCDENGIVYNGFVRVMKGTRSLGVNVLAQIKQALPTLNTDWVLFGIGEPDIKYDLEKPDADPMETLFLKYLDNPKIRKKIKSLLKETENE